MRPCFSVLALVLASTSVNAFAQEDEHGHAGDVEFGYNSLQNPTELVFEFGADAVTVDGIPYFEGSFEELDPMFDAGNLAADEPGFETNELEDLLVNEGDSIFLKFLDASADSETGVGYVNFYNPDTGRLEPSGRLAVVDNAGTATADLILSGDEIESGVNRQFLGLSAIEQGEDVPEVHDHLLIDLLDDTIEGAYGVLLQLQSSNASIADSQPFWFILNNGLSEPEFDGAAVRAFTTGVPEPGSLSLLAAFGLASVSIRRRR